MSTDTFTITIEGKIKNLLKENFIKKALPYDQTKQIINNVFKEDLRKI